MNEDDDECAIENEENIDVEVTSEKQQIPADGEKSNKRKSKKGVFDKEWLKMVKYKHFLKEYKSDPFQSVFSQRKHLVNDKRNCRTTELIAAELNIRLNAVLPCADMYKYILSNQDLLKAIRSVEKYTFRKKLLSKFVCLFNYFFVNLWNKI
jgi:hypothetical protein